VDVVLGLNTVGRVARVEVREVAWSDSNKDMAVLKLESMLDHPTVQFNPVEHVQDGDEVIAIGFPGAADLGDQLYEGLFIPTTTFDHVQRITPDPAGRILIQHGAATNPGNSGGPLFNACGQIVGINAMKSLASLPGGGRVPEGDDINWSIAINEILPQLENLGLSPTTTDRRCAVERESVDDQLRSEVERLREEVRRLRSEGPQGSTTPSPQSEDSLAEQYRQEIERIEASISNPFRDYLFIASLLIAIFAVVVAFTKQGRVVVKEAANTVGRVASESVDWATGAAVRSSIPRVKGVEGVHADSEFKLKNGASLCFGRDPAFADKGVCFSPSTEGVSKRHCTLTFDKRRGKFMLEDHYSTFGTFVNDGQKVKPGTPHPLYPGDQFYLGYPDNEFRVQL